ncbi:MAG: 3-dehydroquinate synthase [Atopobiaceae bacterium]|nr:3-dehydroquinate synthase [Atopobiaceae bacterium]
MSDETTAEKDREPEAGETVEKGPAPVAASAQRTTRQWVVMRGASMDLRVGEGILPEFARVLKSAAGRPHLCLLVHEPGAPEDVVRTLHDNLCAEGFWVVTASLDATACDLDAVTAFVERLDEARVTRDDIVLAVGGYRTLSVASYACDAWCGGVQLAEVPLDLPSAVLAATTPRALDAAGRERMLEQDSTARYTALDLDVLLADAQDGDLRLAFALMVQTALCESDRSFGRLWDNADALAAGDRKALAAQLADALKSRGKVSSSNSAALRQSLELGTTFATALASVAPGPVDAGEALADGMRFAARLGVVQESLSIDDMLAIDEVLERLGVGTSRVAVDPAELVAAIRAERYARTRRFMLAVPRALGRVRLAVMTEELLTEHVTAWCASRPTD